MVIRYEYVKPIYEAHKKSDYATIEDNLKFCFARLAYYKKRDNFNDIARDAHRELALYLERFFFSDQKFISEVLQLATRHINHLAKHQIIN